jgi:hypothetical protein
LYHRILYETAKFAKAASMHFLQVNALQRRCMFFGTHEVDHDGAMRRYGFCLVAGLLDYDSSLARETAAWFFYTLSQVNWHQSNGKIAKKQYIMYFL